MFYSRLPQLFHRRSVVHHVVLLLCIALVSLTAIIGANVLAGGRLRQLDQQLANEKVKLELNGLLQQRLLRLRNELQAISFSSSTREYGLHDKNGRRLLGDILSLLHVLEHGGVFEDRYLVNFGNEEEVTSRFEYKNINKGRLEIEIIELKTHLEELQGLSREFSNLIFQRDQLAGQGMLDQNRQLDKKILFFFKGIQPFFGRILENANRIYFESHTHLLQISAAREQVRQQGNLWGLLISGGTVLLLLSVGTVLLRDIRRILGERDLAHNEAQEARDNLEREIELRTGELLQSNSQLRREVAERKQAQDTVRSQADFLHNTIEALDHPFYVVDVENYRVILSNSAAARLGDGAQTSCYQLTHRRPLPCEGDEHPCPLQEVLRTGKPCIVEHVHFDQHGLPQHVEVHGYPIFDAAGRVVQMIEYSLDISEKKAAEQALHRSNEELEERVAARTRDLAEEVRVRQAAELAMEKTATHFRRLIEHAPGVVLIVETSGTIRYASPSVGRIAGYLPEELQGLNLFGFTHDEDDPGLECLLHLQELSEKTLSREFRFRHRDDRWIEVDSVISNHLDEPSIGGIVVNLWDISQRKQWENRLRHLSRVVEQSSNAVVITDTDGIIQYVNPAFVVTTGFSEAEALGQNPSMLKSGMTPERVYQEMWGEITSGRVWNGEFINRRKNGEIYEESVHISPMRDEEGRITHYIATKENITELKRTRRQAEEASRIKSTFLANMSHEIRTPLNGIIGFIELLARRDLDNTQLHYVGVIRKSAAQLLHVINEVLDLAKVESGRMSLDPAPVDLAAKIEPAVEVFYGRAAEKHIDFLAYIDPELPRCLLCDVPRLNQVLTNLINNAIKFTPEGGRVSVEILRQDSDAGRCRVSCVVRDSGIGIPEDKQREIFLPFAQADSSTTRSYGGTGLGLTISKSLVELMGGELRVDSSPGQGAEFSFGFTTAICRPEAEGAARARMEGEESFTLVLSGGAADGAECHLARYLRAMHCELHEVPLAAFSSDPGGLTLAVLARHPAADIEELGRRCGRRLILVVEPGAEDEAARLCPVASLLTQPLNASKIQDAVATSLERKRPRERHRIQGLRPFAGRRLLVAEDNPINQELAQLVLEEMGIRCDVAVNGVEALRFFVQGGYDLVLMDVNMPEMDGVEATHKILELERAQGREHVPIVALTAHAFKEERQRILAAGMDNYLTKPLDPDKLQQVLGLYLRNGRKGPPPPGEKRPAGDAGAVERLPLETEGWDLAATAREIGIKPAVLERMLRSFRGQLESALLAMDAAARAADAQALCRSTALRRDREMLNVPHVRLRFPDTTAPCISNFLLSHPSDFLRDHHW